MSFVAAGLLMPCERPLLRTDTSKPPSPLLAVVVVTAVTLGGFAPNKPPPVLDPPKSGAANVHVYS